MSNIELTTAVQLAPVATLFEEGFESPVVPGYLQGVPTVGWLGSSNGFGAERIGLNNEDSTDWVSPGPADEQGVDPNYTNTGAITAEGVIGPININTVTYRFTITVAYDKFLSGKLYGAASGAYDVRLCAFEPGFLATGLGSRSDFVGVGAIQKARAFVSLTGSVANDNLVHTFVGEYTTDPVNDIGRKGYDLAIAVIGATASAIITSVKVELLPGARRVNWSPDLITTAAWYDAADPSTIIDTTTPGQVEQLSDKSGNANHMVQATGSAQPITGTRSIGGLNAIDLDGATDFMDTETDFFDPQSDFTIFSVYLDDDPVGNNLALLQNLDGGGTGRTLMSVAGGAFRSNLGGVASALYTEPAVAALNTITHDWDGANTTIASWLNGSAQFGAVVATEANSASNLRIGTTKAGAGITCWNGLLGEMIIIPSVVDTATRQRIEGYLAHKWGLTANLPDEHPYKDAAPTVLWTPSDMTTAAWYDAADTSTIVDTAGEVTNFNDKSGNNRNLEQPTTLNRPITGVRTINGLNTLLHDGNDSLQNRIEAQAAAVVPVGSKVFVFQVQKHDTLGQRLTAYFGDADGENGYGTSGDNLEFHMGLDFDGSNHLVYAQDGDATTGRFFIEGVVAQNTTPIIQMAMWDRSATQLAAEIWHNGVLSASGAQGTGAADHACRYFKIGSTDASRGIIGLIGETIIVHNISAETRQKIEGYLAHKWGLQANLPPGHPYKIDPPHV